MSYYKLNTLHLHLSDWNGFRLQSNTYPGLSSAHSYTHDQIKDLEDYAKKHFVNIVPEIDLPGHSTHIINYNPHLKFPCSSMQSSLWQSAELNSNGSAWTIDITEKKNRDWIKNLLIEYLKLFSSENFHIGGDEIQFDQDKYDCPELVNYQLKKGYDYPSDVFIEWQNEVNELLRSYNKKMQLWNWWGFENHQGSNNYSIPLAKDITINVWKNNMLQQTLDSNYQVIRAPNNYYIVPGRDRLQDPELFYEKNKLREHENIEGYKLCVWADGAENMSDEWFYGFFYLPLRIFAEKTWHNGKERDYLEFIEHLETITSIKKINAYPNSTSNKKCEKLNINQWIRSQQISGINDIVSDDIYLEAIYSLNGMDLFKINKELKKRFLFDNLKEGLYIFKFALLKNDPAQSCFKKVFISR